MINLNSHPELPHLGKSWPEVGSEAGLDIPYVVIHCDSSGTNRLCPERQSVNRRVLLQNPEWGECWRCHYQAELIDGKLPEHGRVLNRYEIAEKVIETIGELLGWQRWSEPVLYACSTATNRQPRLETIEEMVAVGMHWLAMNLTRRGASLETAAAVDKMTSYVVHDIDTKVRDQDYGGIPPDAPFFTEAVLYPVLGKEAARTVLALMNRVRRAVGGI